MPEPIVSQIKYYRGVLDALVNKVDQEAHSITFSIDEGHGSLDDHMKASRYQVKVVEKALEARMQLGNTLKYISEDPDPYREAALKRMSMETEYIPDRVDRGEEKFHFPQFNTKIRTLDYIREVLSEMKERIMDVYDEVLVSEGLIHLEDAICQISLCRNYCGKILSCIKDMKENESA